MTISKQLNANRLNAQRSTGPKTPKGKAIVAQNPLKHGIFSRQIVLGSESKEEFEALKKEFYDHFHPYGLLEMLFCERALAAAWRLSRVTLIESTLFNQASRDSFYDNEVDAALNSALNDRLALLSRYEVSLEKILFRSLSELKALQANPQNDATLNGFVPQNLLEDLHEES